jgi:hypothetical protein
VALGGFLNACAYGFNTQVRAAWTGVLAPCAPGAPKSAAQQTELSAIDQDADHV